MTKGKCIDEMKVGDSAHVSKTVTEVELNHFAQATGDFNPVHFDEAYAKKTSFEGRIAHGVLSIGFISAVFGNLFPGPGTIYLSQESRFLSPVRIGDTVTVAVEVIEMIHEKNRVKFRTTCTNQMGEVVLDGVAWVNPPTP